MTHPESHTTLYNNISVARSWGSRLITIEAWLWVEGIKQLEKKQVGFIIFYPKLAKDSRMISRLNANSSHILQHYDQVRAGKLEIEGGIYDLKSGRVEWLVRNFIQLHIRVKGMNSYTNLWVILIWFVGPPAECFFKPPMFVQVLGQKSSWVQTGENRQQRGPIFEAEDWRTIGGFSTSECDLCHCGPASRSFSIQFLPIWYLRNLLRVCVCVFVAELELQQSLHSPYAYTLVIFGYFWST